MLINKRKLIVFLIYVIMIPQVFLLKGESLNYTNLSLISLFELIVFLIGQWGITKKFFNYSMIFIVLLYVFHFGQVILLGLFPELSVNEQITLKYFTDQSCLNGLKILNIAFYFMCIGIIFSLKPQIIKNNLMKINVEEEKYLYEKSLIMIILTFPVKLIIDSIFFITSMKMGLSSGLYLLNSIPNFIVTFGNLSVVGFCMILISLQSKPKKQKIVFLLIVSYFILLMLCGRRSENVAYICILSFFFLKCYREKVNIKTVTLIIILGVLFLNVLYAIVYSRQRNDGQNISNFITAFQYALTKKNIFIESLREYGNTGYTAIAVISNWLPMFGPTNGLSILYSLTALIPNIIGVAGKLTSLGNYALILQKTTGILPTEYLNIGGSLFGELFFNFGIIGCCISCLIIGYFVGLLSEKLNFYLAKGCYFKIAYYIATYISIIYWIRDRIAGGVRYAVWGAFLVYISHKFFLRRRSR